ncbi:hypothetical protein HNQ59_001821 [Chitinivorax tropicus]|uniref:CAAX prenyl protease 2/Lysostaphin resistance protein A-like domain-containing protein n=1 Tax=Chitinivorax tropicus TaxID=714531 RepID=A0A840MP60_9PROT|nr:CPBP family intramembrane glutamic endopeptidase [Chitinivorax tropicus]MBB5018532.1 hypothetical protein [Chitinivorax tropicus]
MLLTFPIYLSCLLLALTIAWCLLAPPTHAAFHAIRWAGVSLTSLSGWLAGLITPIGLLSLLGLAVLMAARARCRMAWHRNMLTTLAVLAALAMALHMLPGFERVVIFHGILSEGSTPARISWTLDKALAGLMLFGLYVPSTAPRPAKTWLIFAISLMLGILMLGVFSGMLNWSPKTINQVALHWLFGNLFLTTFAEEVVFRHWLQNSLAHHLAHRRFGTPMSIALAGVAFGVAHLAGGPLYALLATLAGCAYGLVYATFPSRWSPVLAHTAFNSLHFFLLTYPLSAGN